MPLRPVEGPGCPSRSSQLREGCSRRSDHIGDSAGNTRVCSPSRRTSISRCHACGHRVLLVSGWLASPRWTARRRRGGAGPRGLAGGLLLLSFVPPRGRSPLRPLVGDRTRRHGHARWQSSSRSMSEGRDSRQLWRKPSSSTRQACPEAGQTAVSMELLGAVARRDSWSCRLRAAPHRGR